VQARLLDALNAVSAIVWGPPTLILLVGTGIYLTVRLRGLQLRMLRHALYLAFVVRREPGDQPGDISHFQALMTALAATVGTGNIAGVATAIATGGPGALFWMWITGLFGMATKYAEAVLAVRFRHRDSRGAMCGGPMYYLTDGLGLPWLGTLFAIFTAIAAFGIGNMVQSNSVADAAEHTFGIAPALSGVIMAVATGAVILGGIRSIGRAASVLVPVMIIFYVSAALLVLIMFADQLLPTLGLVLREAFTPTAARGGFVGASVMLTIRMGVARGVFSNESGLGSAPIAAAAAQTRHPVAQAMVSMTQTFIDTIVICTMTGLVILMSGIWNGGQTGAELTTAAFSRALPGNDGGLIVAVGLILFAYTTLLGWSYYGEKAIEYLLGERVIPWYRGLWCALIVAGAVAKLDLVWTFADVMNGLMALPNLVGLLGMAGLVVRESREYFAAYERGESSR
jgi:alanine or glycine:cation symporter, AGCS family